MKPRYRRYKQNGEIDTHILTVRESKKWQRMKEIDTHTHGQRERETERERERNNERNSKRLTKM